MKNFKVIAIVVVLTLGIAARLLSNKNSFDHEQKLASETSGAVPVLTQKVTYQPITNQFVADGIFAADKEVVLSSEVSAKVIALYAEVGDHVYSGQVLAVLDHSVLDVQLQQAKTNLQKREKDLQRSETLVSTDGATVQQLEQSTQEVIDARAVLANLQNLYDNSFIKAPFDGVITKRLVEKGSFLSPGNETFDLMATSRMKLLVKVTSGQISSIQKGQNVSVSIDDVCGESIAGTVYSINEKANQSKQYEIEISLSSTLNDRIKPGMFGKASFSGPADAKALVIPRLAIPGSIKDAQVYVVKGDSALLTKIEVIPLNEKEVIVTQGLQEGDVLVVSGQINLGNRTKVKSIQ